jgi:hypothetical protein
MAKLTFFYRLPLSAYTMFRLGRLTVAFMKLEKIPTKAGRAGLALKRQTQEEK